MARLGGADRKPIVTQLTTLYRHGEQKVNKDCKPTQYFEVKQSHTPIVYTRKKLLFTKSYFKDFGLA